MTEDRGRLTDNHRMVCSSDYYLMPPSKPTLISVQVPIVTWIDFVTYILSSFGFWFAFSPLVSLLAFKKKSNEYQEETGGDSSHQLCANKFAPIEELNQTKLTLNYMINQFNQLKLRIDRDKQMVRYHIDNQSVSD